jgi:hypothetical protein
MSSWQAVVVATVTGAPLAILRDEMDVTDEQFEDLIAHWKRTVVLEHNGVVRFAGLIENDEQVARGVKLTLTDIWGLWRRRGAWDHNAASIAAWSVSYTGLSLRTLCKRAVQRGTTGPASPPISLPITLEADVAGALDRWYFGYHLETVGDVLDDLALEGVKIDFRGRWLADFLDWQMLTDPDPGVMHEWWVDAPGGKGVTNFRRHRDGSKTTNNSIFVGEGAEEAMLVASQADEASDLPLLDRIDSRKYVTDTVQLQRLADEGAVVFGPPTDAWSFDILANGDPGASGVMLGDTVRLWFAGHWRIPDGSYDRRVTRIEGNITGENVTITVQPTAPAGGVDHMDDRQELERLDRRVKALETASPMNHTSISYYDGDTSGIPISYYDEPGGTENYSGSGITGIGIDTVEKITRTAYDALGSGRPGTTAYLIDESS